MDPSIFLQYSPPNGLPQESKLATYMNRSTSTPTRSLNQALGKLTLDSSPTAIRKVLIGEFMPMNYFTPFLPESPESSPPSTLVMQPPQVHQENVGGTTYFYSTNDTLNATGVLNSSGSLVGPESCMGVAGMVGPVQLAPSPYISQMYAAPPALIGPIAQVKPGLAASFYMPETIRSEIYERNEEVFLQTDLRQFPDLPENVEMYTELTPIECNPHAMATSYRATHRQTGAYVALRRLHGHGHVPTKRFEMWKHIDHPNVVRLLEYFPTNAFGDHCQGLYGDLALFFGTHGNPMTMPCCGILRAYLIMESEAMILVYDYHPGCVTVMNKFLSGGGGSAAGDGNTFHDPFSSDPDAPRPYTHQKNAMLRAVACGALLPEAVLWSLLVQLTAALRAIHTAGLACRTLDPTKVVMNGCRVRVAWCGIADSMHANNNDVTMAQQEDLSALGRLALALACRTIHCENLPASMDLVSRTYSADLKNLILYLLSTTPARRSVTDLMPMIGARFYTQVEALERRADAFEDQLAREVDNGRLLRILIKLGVINERPELNMDTSWSETGDRYMLKLFRDYLFHSVDTEGRPWLDYAHLSHCLNQLDGGTANRVELMSRDEQSVLVVSYAELKHCLEQSFEEVNLASSAPI